MEMHSLIENRASNWTIPLTVIYSPAPHQLHQGQGVLVVQVVLLVLPPSAQLTHLPLLLPLHWALRDREALEAQEGHGHPLIQDNQNQDCPETKKQERFEHKQKPVHIMYDNYNDNV